MAMSRVKEKIRCGVKEKGKFLDVPQRIFSGILVCISVGRTVRTKEEDKDKDYD